jgi:hypothetical protein
MNADEFFSAMSSNENTRLVDKIILTAEFRDLPDLAKHWRGFKGRILPYTVDPQNVESGNRIFYRKTFEPNSDCVVALKTYKRNLKSEFVGCKTVDDFLSNGLDEDALPEQLKTIDRSKSIPNAKKVLLEEINDLYDIDETVEEWFENPGGIPGNVLSRLPRFLLIPAQDKIDELTQNSGTLISILNELFTEIRESSDNYKKAQEYLDKLAAEMDPSDVNSNIGTMIKELNGIMSDIFPNTGVNAEASLSDANNVIKPQFKISMFSNITSPVNLQGTGLIRSAVFALLRYKSLRDNRLAKSDDLRSLIIGFEEPELYLHPNAACKMRDTIYQLAESGYCQIVCTTHSPYMIDLSKKPSQVLNNLCLKDCDLNYRGNDYKVKKITAYPFNTTNAFKTLQDGDKQYIKMILKMDDSVSRSFFVNNVLIVEGDTEEIVLKESIRRLPEIVRNDILSNWQIIRARGKAAIIPLVRYLHAMEIHPSVMHDEDSQTPNASKFNVPIAQAVNDSTKVTMLHDCVEDALGYTAPSAEKPFKAYEYIGAHWGEDWDSVDAAWKQVMEKVFSEPFKLLRP